ncbi:hypothetical protein MRX96_057318 [Rhipicephalus microplus]
MPSLRKLPGKRKNGFMTHRTLYTYIKNLKADLWFDANLFAVLNEKLAAVPERERRGVLKFDEMSVRKSLHVRESDMALLGKVNFAEHTRPGDNEKDADHVLVFLFRPFLGGWSQTVGTFCASSAAPGSVAAKLLLQCIVHLENSGSVVQAVTCDNSTSNRSALMHKKQPSKGWKFLLPEGDVYHDHFKSLLGYEEDQAGLRAVPKLTKAHIMPNAFQKMSVRLALFSESTAAALEFYSRQDVCKELHDSKATAAFTRRMNGLFDCLNSRRPEHVQYNEAEHIATLKENVTWLNNCCDYIESLPKQRQACFLTKPTSEALRVTLLRTIALVENLLASGFRYVLVGNFGQDPLEVDSLAILLDDVLLEPTESEEEALADLSPMKCILDYLAGYVAQKFSEMCCTDCVKSLKGLQRSPSDLILVKSRVYLQVPSTKLLNLLRIAEEHVKEFTVKLTATSSDRITTPGAEKEPWATKAKKTSQPQVKGGADSEHVSFELVSSIQKENATLRSNVKQLKAEIAEIKGSKVVNAAPPSWPNRHVENIGESRIAEVSMDTHSEVRTAERKATTEHMRNEELDFKVQTTSSLAEIKETLKQMTVAMASLGARTSKLEEELSKLRAKKGVKLLVKSRATSLGGDLW